MAYGSWLDLIKFNGPPILKDACSEVQINCPEFTGVSRLGTSCPIKTESVNTDRVRGAIRLDPSPLFGFRDVNEGVPASKGKYQNTEFHLYQSTATVAVDVALIDRDAARGARYLQNETKSVMEGLTKGFGSQFYYGGTTNGTTSAKGFDGIQKYVESWGSDLTISAGGTAANSGETGLTSAYLVRFDSTDGVSWLIGNGGAFTMDDPRRESAIDPNNPANTIPVVRQMINCYTGLAYYSKYAACRIANIQTSSTAEPSAISSTALTLNHFGVALEKMRGAPSVILMNYKAGLLLSAAIGTMTVGGTTVALGGTLPKDYAGIPICYTDSICNNEAAVTLA